MDKEVKAKWIKALRSGQYKQSRQNLYDGKGYCCLGVLARVQGAQPKEIRHRGFLTAELACYAAGLRIESQYRLGRLNDGTELNPKQTFKEIADYIEKKYK